ncbi:hypothetical protein [Streptomyces sp. NPDC007063]|uniref:hypothetical protein n=1 Tax=Streptomyces sp. NPDC007063 TaxID=3364772 RepID=UPI0036CCDDEB
MADLAPFPDVEDVLADALAGFGETGSEYPADLEAHLPFVRIRRTGGDDDRRTDRPLADVEVAAATRAQAWEIARQVQQRLLSGPIRVPGVGIVDRASTQVGLRHVLHENPNIRCVLATYRPSLRRLT